MKSIDVENDLYRYIASQTESIGEDASAILRRLLGLPAVGEISVDGPLKDPVEVKKSSKQDVKKQTVTSDKSDQEKTIAVVSQAISNNSPSDFNQLIMPSVIVEHKAAVSRFLFLLEKLHQISPINFEQVLSISGRDRVYFAKDEATLLGANASTKPKQIGNTEFWVITNSNTSKKRAMLTKSLEVVGCHSPLAKKIAEQI